MADQQSALSLVGSKVLVCSFPCLDLVTHATPHPSRAVLILLSHLLIGRQNPIFISELGKVGLTPKKETRSFVKNLRNSQNMFILTSAMPLSSVTPSLLGAKQEHSTIPGIFQGEIFFYLSRGNNDVSTQHKNLIANQSLGQICLLYISSKVL